MKRKIFIALLLVLTLAFTLVLASCGGDSNTDTDTSADTNTDTGSSEITYTVKVVDYTGAPITSGLFVQMYKDGEELGSMKKSNKNGEASFTLEKGEYTFELVLTDDTVTYDKSSCVLTEKAPSKEIMLYSELGNREFVMYPYDSELGERYEYRAKFINEGATLVPIEGMTYYVFEPTRGGIYKFSYISDVALTIGYFGGSEHFVFEESSIEVKDRAFTIEVKDSGVSSEHTGTTRIIIGVRSLVVDSCVMTIERISDPVAEIPRIDYLPIEYPSEVCSYSYLNATLVDVDVLDKNLSIVYNAEDGFFHHGDENGPIVLVRITSASKYLASFSKICETAALYGSIYDDSGKLLRTEIYNNMIATYAEKCDDSGVVPLTRELLYAVTNMGNHSGWFEGEQSIFRIGQGGEEDGTVIEGTLLEVPLENAPYFACCYLVPNDFGSSEDKRITITDTTEPKEMLAALGAGETLYFKGARLTKTTLKITDAQGLKVIFNGEEYTPSENGIIEISFDATSPIEFQIVNENEISKDAKITYTTFIA